MDNATAHLQDVYDDLPDGFDFFRVKFQPHDTTPLLQLMDLQVISIFKNLYARALFQKCFMVTNNMQPKLLDFFLCHFTIELSHPNEQSMDSSDIRHS